MKLDLKGKWQFRATDETDFFEATVPGCNYLDLMNLGKLPDPYVADNEKQVAWVAEKDWLYCRTFNVSAALLACDKVYLVAEGLDTLCEVAVNGTQVFIGQNAHIAYRVDIKAHLKEGVNELAICFRSPTRFVELAYAACKTPQNANGQTGIVHIRKPQYHFGWDFAPVLPLSGITGDIFLEGVSGAEITSFKVTQSHRYDGSVTLEFFCETASFTDAPLSTLFSVKSPSGEEYLADGVDTGNGFKALIEIEKPELWWTRELSGKDEQPLYEVVCALSAGDTIVAGKILKVGLRTIKLNRDKDEFGRNFCFELNGVKIFCKGANFIPPDCLTLGKNKYSALLSDAAEANMNMLRVWGGGVYPADEFYDECDKRGILVWQDFGFACQAYPFFVDSFLKNVENEVDYQVKRLRHHASLALWCGNNEIEQMSVAWLWMKAYIEWTEKYFYEILPAQIKALDGRDYLEGSPSGIDYLYGQFADNVGDKHIWEVWHGLQPVKYYRKRLPRFCSEFGFESIPDEKTLAFFGDENLSLKSPVFKGHHKCDGGAKKLLYYVLDRFRTPADFSNYTYITQLCQAEAVKTAAEHMRRNKRRCNGSLFWQLNDCWPAVSWAGVDFFGRQKAVMSYARRFYQPLAVSIEDSDGGFYVYTVNDTKNDYSAKLIFKVCEYDGKVLVEKEKEIEIKAGESQNQLGLGMAAVRIQNKKLRAYAVAEIVVDDKVVSQSTVLLRREKYAKLPKPEIKTSFDFPSDGVLSVTLTSNVYARAVRLTNDFSDAPFSDNYFDLLPGVPVTVTENLGKICPISAVENAVKVFSAADLSTRGNLLYDFFKRLGVLLTPICFLSRLYTRRAPHDIKKRRIILRDEDINE